MSYHRATILRLRDEAFHFFERLSDGAFRTEHPRLVDWLPRVRSTFESGPRDVTAAASEAAETLRDVLASGSDDAMETAAGRALRKLAHQLQHLVQVCEVPALAIDDDQFLEFLETALRVDKQMVGSTPIDPADVARRSGLDVDVTYLCIVRACDEALAHLPRTGEAGFHLDDEEIPDATRRLRKSMSQKEASPAPAQLEASSADVRVLIASALFLEAAAVLGHLSGIHEEVHPNGTIYEVGTLATERGPIKVAVVRTGAGNALAAQETERALAHYRPKIAIFVGVAGGRKDVGVGDIVLASKVYGYESGKDEAAGFRPRPEVEQPTYTLQRRAEQESQRDGWLGRLAQRPSHRPNVVTGAVASGQKVVASSTSQVSNLLGDSYGDALAVEMEGLGFLQACRRHKGVEALVVRGISDLLDGKLAADASGSQPQAAAHAAAFAIEVLAAYLRQSALPADATGPSQSSPSEGHKQVVAATATSPFEGWIHLPPKAKLTSAAGLPVLPIVYQLSAELDPPLLLTKTELEKVVGESAGSYSMANYARVARWPRAVFLGERRSSGSGLLWVFEWEPSARNEAGDDQLFADRHGKLAFQRDIFWDVETPAVDLGLMAEDTWKFLRFVATLASRSTHDGHLRVSLGLIRPSSHASLGAHFGGIDAEQDCSAELTRDHVTGHVACAHQTLLHTEQLASTTKRLVDQVANEFEARFSAFGVSSHPIVALDLRSISKSIERGTA